MKRAFAHIGFSAAITLIAVNLINVKYIPIIAIGLAAGFAVSLMLPKYRQAVAVPLCLGSALFACLVFLCVYYSAVQPAQMLDGQKASVSFYITDFPEVTNRGYLYTVKAAGIFADGAPQGIKLRINTDYLIDADLYQVINADASFTKIGNSAFSSYGYWGKEIFLSASLDRFIVTDEHVITPMYYVLNLRKDIIFTLAENVRGDAGAIAAAFITGDKTFVSNEIYRDFLYAGASHLMAVSGLHLSVVTGFAYYIFKRSSLNNKALTVIMLFLIVFYAALAGFSKSIIRAGIMMGILLLGELAQRKADALNSLGLAVFVISLNPFAVCDMSAVLSVLSVLSLTTMLPLFKGLRAKASSLAKGRLERIEPFAKILSFALNGFLVSLCITAYTMPVMYMFFGSFSLSSLVSNILLVPLGSTATVVSIITYCADKLSLLGGMFNFICEALCNVIIALVKLFASFSLSQITFGRHFGFAAACTLILFGICFILGNKNTMKIAAVVSCILVVFMLTAGNIVNYCNAQIYLSSDNAVVITCDGKTVVYGVETESDYYSVSRYLRSNRRNIDLFIINQANDNCIELTNEVNCDKIVIGKEDEEIIKNALYNDIVVSGNYRNILSENFEIKYYISNDYSYLRAETFGVSFVRGRNIKSNTNIIVSKRKACDDYGTIDLSKGDALYEVYRDKSYEARRVDIWQE